MAISPTQNHTFEIQLENVEDREKNIDFLNKEITRIRRESLELIREDPTRTYELSFDAFRKITKIQMKLQEM